MLYGGLYGNAGNAAGVGSSRFMVVAQKTPGRSNAERREDTARDTRSQRRHWLAKAKNLRIQE